MSILKKRAFGHGFKIEGVVAFVSIDERGEEGVIAMYGNDGSMMPAICADEERVKLIAPRVEAECKRRGVQYRVIKLSIREDVTDEVKKLYLTKQ